jgi:hypothetical protein
LIRIGIACSPKSLKRSIGGRLLLIGIVACRIYCFGKRSCSNALGRVRMFITHFFNCTCAYRSIGRSTHSMNAKALQCPRSARCQTVTIWRAIPTGTS